MGAVFLESGVLGAQNAAQNVACAENGLAARRRSLAGAQLVLKVAAIARSDNRKPRAMSLELCLLECILLPEGLGCRTVQYRNFSSFDDFTV